jgi:hypothetical protein
MMASLPVTVKSGSKIIQNTTKESKKRRPIMPKLTELRMREILSTILRDDTMLDSYDCDAVTGTIVNHPEIKSLFECEGREVLSVHKSETMQGILKGICPSCPSIVYTNDLNYLKCCCGQKLIWPTEATKESEVEYEVIEYETAILMGISICETRCANTGSMVNSLACKSCKYFAGHEVEGKSVRCKHRFNEGEA